MNAFDLTTEEWIPLITHHGDLQTVGLRDALARSHEFREVYCNSPLETIALNRLLLALAIRIFPESLDEDMWMEMYNRGSFNSTPITEYFDKWQERFDLLHPERPFYQHPSPLNPNNFGINKLFFEQSSGNNATLFGHEIDETPPQTTLSMAARGLVALQSFAIGGLIGAGLPSEHAPMVATAVFWLRGNSLFDALMLNAPPDERCRLGTTNVEDSPTWEKEVLPGGARRVPSGYLDYLTHLTQNLGSELLPVQGIRPYGNRVQHE
ncbi:MAG: type I-E CRISPR-associated protein Cse1/CasA [Chlorobi bacterium CHB2]|nr:type I-E CRISPR-associated protein Cse1/CasA [Chlorobi bacterium CHB2]